MNRYYVLRDRTTDECKTCREWENMANSGGGFQFGEGDIKKAIKPDVDGRTHLFHHNCRCTLSESPDGIPIADELDRKVLFSGGLGHAYFKEKTPQERLDLVRKYEK